MLLSVYLTRKAGIQEMKNTTITPIEGLITVIAFKPKEIQVNQEIYVQIPDFKKEDFDLIICRARESYDKQVAEIKETGERPRYNTLKADIISEMLYPFLDNLGIEHNKKATKRVSSTSTKVSKMRAEKEAEDAVVTNVALIREFYDNNFPVEELLEDSKQEREELSMADLNKLNMLFLDDEESLFGEDIIISDVVEDDFTSNASSCFGGFEDEEDDIDAHGVSFEDDEDDLY